MACQWSYPCWLVSTLDCGSSEMRPHLETVLKRKQLFAHMPEAVFWLQLRPSNFFLDHIASHHRYGKNTPWIVQPFAFFKQGCFDLKADLWPIGLGQYAYLPIQYYHNTWMPIWYVLWFFSIVILQVLSFNIKTNEFVVVFLCLALFLLYFLNVSIVYV